MLSFKYLFADASASVAFSIASSAVLLALFVFSLTVFVSTATKSDISLLSEPSFSEDVVEVVPSSSDFSFSDSLKSKLFCSGSGYV